MYSCQADTQLILAARSGDIATLKRVLTEGHEDVNVMNAVGVLLSTYY